MQNQSRDSAKKTSAYHCTRLKGVSRCLRALWPHQRAPQWFKGNDQGWIHAEGSPGTLQEHGPLDDGNQVMDVRGVDGVVNLKSLQDIKSTHGITAQIISKPLSPSSTSIIPTKTKQSSPNTKPHEPGPKPPVTRTKTMKTQHMIFQIQWNWSSIASSSTATRPSAPSSTACKKSKNS